MRVLPLILLAVALSMTGCVSVESEKPLSPPQSAVRDPRVEGLWSADDKSGGAGYLYIVYRAGGEGSLMEFGKDDGGNINSMQYDFFVTRTSKHNYANLSHGVSHDQNGTHTDRTGRYIFVEYHFSWRGQLVFSQVQGDAFSKAVEAGKLRGSVTYDTNDKGVKSPSNTVLTDSSERILAFIESSKPGDVFSPPTKFNNIGGP